MLLYLAAVLIVQTVIIPHFSFLGVTPDLALVSVITIAVLQEQMPATLFAAALGFGQDLLGGGFYWNTIIKTIASTVVNSIESGLSGDEYSFVAILVAGGTPLTILAERALLYFMFHQEPAWFYLCFQLLAGTLYNLLFVPLLFPIIKRLSDAAW